jgi:NAD(P)-dependent dehydrogenase (short-subunit alcohol dehydrogenase family)
MDTQLEGKVALVTGASSGIGEATTRLLIAEGARVGALSRARKELERAVERMTREGGEAIPLVADISRPDEVADAVEQLMAHWGRLDIVFANAGINGTWAPIDELSPEEWRHTIDINLNGTFYTLKYTVPHLKERGGAIVVTASVNGTRMFSNSGASAYATSKAGQVALTKMLALELAEYDIRVNVVCPGAVQTEIEENTEREELQGTGWPADYPRGRVPLRDGKAGTPEQVARLVLFLASDAADLITGTPVWIDGAESLLQG